MQKSKNPSIANENKIKHFFLVQPVWRLVIRMALPTVLVFLAMGIYSFIDSIFAIHFAAGHYTKEARETGISAGNLVRLFIQTAFPIYMIVNSTAVFFGVGIATRVSINLGKGRTKYARSVLRTGMTFAIILSVFLMLLLFLSAPTWIASQVSSKIVPIVVPNALSFTQIIILSLPVLIFNQVLTNLLRSEGKTRLVTVAWILPIGMNLFLDWVFMGPGQMGVEGAAAATLISYVIGSCILITGMFVKKNAFISFKNMFGFKGFKWFAIISVALVGVAPFLRGISSSITQTTQFNLIKDVSDVVYFKHFYILAELARMAVGINPDNPGQVQAFMNCYNQLMHTHLNTQQIIDFIRSAQNIHSKFFPTLSGNALQIAFQHYYARNEMTLLSSGIFPIFSLFFPSVFGFASAGRPIIGYNYGAKRFDRVRKTYWITILITFINAIFLYVIAVFVLGKPMLILLGFSGENLQTAYRILKIYMLLLPVFAVSVAGMLLLGATDRIVLSVFAATLQNILLLFPVILTFRSLSIHYSNYTDFFWWYSPTRGLLASIIIFGVSYGTLRRLETRHTTLEDRLQKWRKYFENHKFLRLRNNNSK